MLDLLFILKLNMGKAGAKRDMPEIEETKAASRDDKFETIVKRIQSVASEFSDETSPLFIDVGNQDFEVGTQRVVEFNLNKFDFQLTRKVETHRLSGEGFNKHVEEMSVPRASIKLKRKSQYETNWQAIDLNDLF
jgi:hypothetical protein